MVTKTNEVEVERPIYDQSGRTAIPVDVRQELGIEENDEIRYRFIKGQGEVILEKV